MTGDLVPVRQFNESIRSFDPDVDRLQRRENFDAETLSLYHSAARQIAPTEADRKSQIVLDAGTHSRLPAGSLFLNHHGVEAFGGSIHSSGKPRRPSTDDRQVIKIGLRARPQTDSLRHLRRHTFEELCSVGKKHDRKTRCFGSQVFQKPPGLRVVCGNFDVNPLIRYAVARKKLSQFIRLGRPARPQNPDSLECRPI